MSDTWGRFARGAELQVAGFAKLDPERELRSGAPEIIYCEGKTVDQLDGILAASEGSKGPLILSRFSRDAAQLLTEKHPQLRYLAEARMGLLGPDRPAFEDHLSVALLAAGTSDLPVAEEAATLLEALGQRVERIYDVGVASLHRLLSRVDQISAASVCIVVAGMEGALPTVVSGLTPVPTVAVPTSVGYGANLQGIAALLGMLNSCSPGMTVVNIDNGVGAALFAHKLLNQIRTLVKA